jgi:hypothetical protein
MRCTCFLLVGLEALGLDYVIGCGVTNVDGGERSPC